MYLVKNRKLNRWLGFDYDTPGWYFVTICIKDKRQCLGNVLGGKMVLNNFGEIALKYWRQISEHYNNIELDEFQIMPNHVHGIIFINKRKSIGAHNVGTGSVVGAGDDHKILTVGTEQCSVPTLRAPTTHYGLLSKMIKSFKEATVKNIKREYNFSFQWQRSFYDHVIRGEKDYNYIKYYIQQNPAKWAEDKNNPINLKK